MIWKKKQAESLDKDLIAKYKLSPIQAKLFAIRGINTDQQLDFWLNADETKLADPFLMHDMKKTVDRINQAIDKGEKITVYGDYDADGITATSIMVETLSILGADVDFFIPNRFDDGYGPSLERYQELVNNGTKLIITVDNGVTGIEEVNYAKKCGVDTIVTDHHIFQDEIPDAYAIVHCNYPNQDYPFDDYCGAGVAYTICRALMADNMSELLDLAMIGTIGDMVKVSGEGHIIVKRGLEILNNTQRPGLRALIKNAGLELGSIDASDVGFAICPRINAVGRLADANLAVNLLLCDDQEEAEKLASIVEKLNDKRKQLTQEIFEICEKQIQQYGWQSKKTLVLYDHNFHEGVLGLVTNKIAEKYHKPTIILTEADNGELKGSGRSVVGFNLFNALIKLKGTVLTKFGGHEFACGLSLKKDSLVKLRNCFESSFQPVATSELVKMYDDELNLNDLTLDTYRQMAKVGPFGTDNPEPVFSITNPHISKLIKIGQNKNHIKMCVSNFSNELDLIGFDRGYLDTNILPYVHMIMVTLGINKWNNKAKLQGIISDFIFAAPPSLTNVRIVDLRNENYIMGFADRYLLFDKKSIEIANNIDNISSNKIILETDYMQNNESVVFLDTPTSKEQFDRVLNNDFNKIYLRFLIDPYPISKLPDRELFENIFSYIVNHPNLSLSDYKLVATYLGINYDCIKFVLRVFWELNWIDYDVKNELIKAITSPKVTKITDSKYFQAISQRLTFTDMLKNMSSDSLLKYIKDHNSNL